MTNAGSTYFADTNLLLYSFDSRDPIKQKVARAWLDYLWQTGEGRLSWQVLHEFYANATRKIGIPLAQAREAVLVFNHWKPMGMNVAAVETAWSWMDQAQVTYRDGLILASAERLGCRWLLSEDFQHGRDYDGVTVIDPFRQLPPADPARHAN